MIAKESLRKFVIACIAIFFVSLFAYTLRKNSQATKVAVSGQSGQVSSPQQDASKQQKEIELNIKSSDSQFVLVNKTYALEPIDYKPGDLVIPNISTSQSDSKDEQSIRELIRPSIEEMFNDARAAGFDLVMNSGFRSYKAQGFYFNNYVRQSGLEAAKKFSAEPGHSEHQTGLAFDVSYSDRSCYLEVCFGQSQAGRWLAANAYKYGFILRYPEGKEEVTGYQYEPWHFRYVGKELAEKVFKSGLSYEEYLVKEGLINN